MMHMIGHVTGGCYWCGGCTGFTKDVVEKSMTVAWRPDQRASAVPMPTGWVRFPPNWAPCLSNTSLCQVSLSCLRISGLVNLDPLPIFSREVLLSLPMQQLIWVVPHMSFRLSWFFYLLGGRARSSGTRSEAVCEVPGNNVQCPCQESHGEVVHDSGNCNCPSPSNTKWL